MEDSLRCPDVLVIGSYRKESRTAAAAIRAHGVGSCTASLPGTRTVLPLEDVRIRLEVGDPEVDDPEYACGWDGCPCGCEPAFSALCALAEVVSGAAFDPGGTGLYPGGVLLCARPSG